MQQRSTGEDDTAEPGGDDPGRARRFVDGDGGLRVAVYERNRDATDPVLLVHGYPDDHTVWDPVVDLLADRFHVITYDVRGAGASGVPDAVAGYRLDALTGDVAAVIDATVPAGRRVHLVGHDWGSIQGWHFVCDVRVAPRIASFTSISGPHLDAVGAWFRREGTSAPSLASVVRQGLKSWYIGAFQVPILAPAFWRSGFARRAWPGVLEHAEGVPPQRLPDGDKIAGTQSDGANGVGLYRANVLSALTHPRRIHTDVPVQVVMPLRDRYVSPELAECVDGVADDLVFVRVDGGHWLPLSDPERVAELVTEHIERHR